MVKTKHIRTAIAMRAMRRKLARPLKTKSLINFKFTRKPLTKFKGVIFKLKNSRLIARSTMKQRLSAATLFATTIMLVISLILPGINARAAQTLTWSSNADFTFNKASKCQATNIDKLVISGSSYTDATCAAAVAESDIKLAPDESDIQGVVSVAMGSLFSIALKEDGTVWSWGENSYGRLGIGTSSDGDHIFPEQVKDSTGEGHLSDMVAVSAGSSHVIALKDDGTVWAWGYNRRNQLGDGTGGSTGNYKALPVQVKGENGNGFLTGITSIAAGNNSSLALKNDGTVWAWGYNNNGQLGNGAIGVINTYPAKVKDASGSGDLSNITMISSNYDTVLALRDDGTVWGWGYNLNSQVGDGTVTNRALPMQVRDSTGTGYMTSVIKAAVGTYNSYVIRSDGSLWGWGANGSGQVGDSTTTDRSLPTRVKDPSGTAFMSDVTDISVGQNHVLALKSDGSLWGWGYNYYGQLGDGSYINRSLPVQVKDNDGEGYINAQNFIAGSTGGLIVTKTGKVYGMGRNYGGELGYKLYASQTSLPISIVVRVEEVPLKDVATMSSGNDFVLVLKDDGTVWAWGYNTYGQLGDNTNTNRSHPVQVKDSTGNGYLSEVVGIATGTYFSMALKDDGTVWAWGHSNYGALGTGNTTSPSYLPTQVKGPAGSGYLTGITSISTSANHITALKDDGTVWAWGYNGSGQIGLGGGNVTNQIYPVQVRDAAGTGYISGVQAVSAGLNNSYALKDDGTVWAWGQSIGLGTNASVNSSLPVQVKDPTGASYLQNVSVIEAGNDHVMALNSDGSVMSWGSNTNGRLGNGTTVNALLPSKVKDVTGTGFLSGITKISAADRGSVALGSDGSVWSWGYDRYGMLGNGSSGSSPYTAALPVQVKNSAASGDYLSEANAVYAGSTYNFVRKNNGNIVGWGRNNYAQLSSGNFIETNAYPVRVLATVNFLSGFASQGVIDGIKFDIGAGKKTKWFSANWSTDSLPADTSVTFNVRSSNDNETWSEWSQNFSQTTADSTSGVADISDMPMSRYIEIKATLATTNNLVTPTLNDFSLSYLEDTVAPDTNAANIIMKRSSSGSVIANDGWINNQTPYFSWNPAVDVEGGAGIQGYCLYLGQDNTADFKQTKGILGDSPLDTGGECAYATENAYLDLSQSGALASELQTDNNPYHLLVKAIDYGANVYEGEAASFTFNYDATPPTNPMFISAPSQFVSTKDVTLTWPNSGLQGPLDSDSQIAGLQYRIGSSGTWYGESHNGNEDLTDLLANDGNYQTTEEFDYDLLNEGNNIVYFRTLDRAGNVSTSYITAVIKINTSSPSQPLNVTAAPSTNTSNSFAFSWHQPATFVGPASGITYCYTINTLPTVNNCSWTKPGQASLSADAYATQPDENIFYVVAKDEAGNINYATYGSVSFTAKTEAPGLPRNFEIADVSTKASETWKIALSWTTPADAGAGVAKYVIYRSTDGTAYSQIATTTGQSYVDGPLAQREYFYQIRACDSANKCGADTEPLSMTPTGRYTTPPELISSVSSEVSTRRASFTWTTDRNSDSRIQYGTESGVYMAGEVTVSEPTKAHAVELLGLDAGTTYYYKVKWTDEDGNTGISSELTFTTLPAPVVKDVQVVKKTLNSALIQFTSTDAAKVSIQYGQSENFGGIKTINTSLTESTYIVELVGLNDGTTYFYKLNTFDSEGNQYDSRRIDTFATPQRPRIANLRFQPVEGEPTSTQKVTWTTNVPTTSTITYGKNGSNGSDIYSSALTTDHVVTVRGLEDDSQYFLLAQSRDADGNLAVSDRQLFRTALDTRPPKISDVLIETSVKGNGSEARGQIVVSWKTDEPATSQVAYADGSGGNYTSRTAEDMRLTTEHVVIISDLSVSKVYHLQPISSDRADNETSGEDQSAIIGRASDSVLNIILNSLYRIFGL